MLTARMEQAKRRLKRALRLVGDPTRFADVEREAGEAAALAREELRLHVVAKASGVPLRAEWMQREGFKHAHLVRTDGEITARVANCGTAYSEDGKPWLHEGEKKRARCAHCQNG